MKLSIFSLPINLLAIPYNTRTHSLCLYLFLSNTDTEHWGAQWHKWQCFEIVPHHITSHQMLEDELYVSNISLFLPWILNLLCFFVYSSSAHISGPNRTHTFIHSIHKLSTLYQFRITSDWMNLKSRNKNNKTTSEPQKKKKKRRNNPNALHCVCPAIKYNETLHKGDNAKHTGSYTNWWCGVYNVRGYHLENKNCLSLSLSISQPVSLRT